MPAIIHTHAALAVSSEGLPNCQRPKQQIHSQHLSIAVPPRPWQTKLCSAGKHGKAVPTFLGYLVHEGATLLADVFVKSSQLPVVLDLDETLLVANSLSQLETQMAKAVESR